MTQPFMLRSGASHIAACWAAAKAAYAEASKPYAALPENYDDKECDAAVDVMYAGFELLVHTPAPTIAEVFEKLTMARERYGEIGDHVTIPRNILDTIEEDLQRITTPPQIDTSEWDEALADYHSKRAASDADENDDALTTIYCEALDHLVENVPAPNNAALTIKLELIAERYEGPDPGEFTVPGNVLQAVRQDASRLGPVIGPRPAEAPLTSIAA